MGKVDASDFSVPLWALKTNRYCKKHVGIKTYWFWMREQGILSCLVCNFSRAKGQIEDVQRADSRHAVGILATADDKSAQDAFKFDLYLDCLVDQRLCASPY